MKSAISHSFCAKTSPVSESVARAALEAGIGAPIDAAVMALRMRSDIYCHLDKRVCGACSRLVHVEHLRSLVVATADVPFRLDEAGTSSAGLG
jgi:hypothetical protein